MSDQVRRFIYTIMKTVITRPKHASDQGIIQLIYAVSDSSEDKYKNRFTFSKI